jgi:hypothetical protein
VNTKMILPLTFLALAACDNKEAAKVEAPVVTTTAAPAVSSAAPVPSAAPIASAAPEVDVETEEDFVPEVESITKATMETELSKLEKDIK